MEEIDKAPKLASEEADDTLDAVDDRGDELGEDLEGDRQVLELWKVGSLLNLSLRIQVKLCFQ